MRSLICSGLRSHSESVCLWPAAHTVLMLIMLVVVPHLLWCVGTDSVCDVWGKNHKQKGWIIFQMHWVGKTDRWSKKLKELVATLLTLAV